MTQTLVAEEVDALVGEIELDALRCCLSETSFAGYRLVAGRHLRRRLKIQIAFSGEFLNQLIEQLTELLLRFLVAITAQRFQKVGRELTALDQRVENCLTQGLE